MPLGSSKNVIKCSKCESLNSEIWHKIGEEEQVNSVMYLSTP